MLILKKIVIANKHNANKFVIILKFKGKKMNRRKTKIFCTIGPATKNVETLVQLINAGMDVARLNFSHGTQNEHFLTIQNLRKAEEITGKKISILQDLQGPKIRIGRFRDGYINLVEGNKFIITTEEVEYGDETFVPTNYKLLAKEVNEGSKLLIDDGYIILEVVKISANNIETIVIKGGKLSDNKGIIAPSAKISSPPLSDKDVDDLKFGLETGIDLVALSFVRSERDVIELKTIMRHYKRTVPIISKIERFEGFEDLDDIIEESDGIMVARGDLGLEMPAEEVPFLQKAIIKKCNLAGKPVITATQMLESMINNPMPTRAEASDVANAVLDGTDAVMLSGETSIGKYPVLAVDYLNRIITIAENKIKLQHGIQFDVKADNSLNNALGKASKVIAEQINADAIIALTKSGYTALNIAKYRPEIPIYAITDRSATLRFLNIVWGIKPVQINEGLSLENILDSPEELLKNFDDIPKGMIVLVSGLSEDTLKPRNMIKILKI